LFLYSGKHQQPLDLPLLLVCFFPFIHWGAVCGNLLCYRFCQLQYVEWCMKMHFIIIIIIIIIY